VGLRVIHIVDPTRRIQLPDGGTEPRELVTEVRYPAIGTPSADDRPGARPAVGSGPFPLVVFGHGFNVTPEPYVALLRAWARAGYVVAAPVFPLENAQAPGGPNENDLINQPQDMSVVITRLLSLSGAAGGALHGMVDRSAIAVSGQSDGGNTALTVAYHPRYRDHRVRAAVILSGMEIPGLSGYEMSSGSPPLLATQGTSDTINPPSFTATFFDAAAPPKYLLNLLGAPHLGPYTDEQPQLGIVERVTIAFMDRYLKRSSRAAPRLVADGNVAGVARLEADP
jgi:dienelactone hydrolase